MQVAVKNIKGQEVRKITLPDAVYNVDVHEHALHTVIKGFLANQRQGTHATKTRSYVSGGGRKPYKQKGTGNARQGSTRSPVHPGGGISHGPQPRDYREKMNKKLRGLALKVALSDRVRHNALVVVDDFAISKYSTKQVLGTLAALKATNALIADERKDDYLHRSARNLRGVAATTPSELNAHAVLRHQALVISETAIKLLTERLEGGKS